MEHENEAGGSSQMKKLSVEGVQTEENKKERQSCEEIEEKGEPNEVAGSWKCQ
jgi:hypothetical protein